MQLIFYYVSITLYHMQILLKHVFLSLYWIELLFYYVYISLCHRNVFVSCTLINMLDVVDIILC